MNKNIEFKIEQDGLFFHGSFVEELFGEWVKIIKTMPNKEHIYDGMLVQVGFNFYKIELIETNEYRILAVDYTTNPFTEFSTDLTFSLWIQKVQSEFVNELQILPKDIRYDDKIIIAKDIFNSESYYLERQDVDSRGDSGWFIGYRNADNDELVSIYAFELLKWNPNLLKCLILPVDYLVIVDNSDISAVVNENNEEIYSSEK